MSSEFFRRRAAFDDLGHRTGLGLCIVTAAATIILLVLSFDPRYDLTQQAAAFLGAVIFATTFGLFGYVSARAVARLVHRVKYGSAKNQPGWQGELSWYEVTNNGRALVIGAALAAAAALLRFIAEMIAGFPQGAVYAIGRMIAAAVIALIIGYAVARMILWARQKYGPPGPGPSGR